MPCAFKQKSQNARSRASGVLARNKKEIVRPGHKVEAAGDVTGGKCLS